MSDEWKRRLCHLERAVESVLACRKLSSQHSNLRMIEVDMFRLAYAELYITIGTLFRRFENLRGNELKPEDLVLDDYFASHHPIDSTKFHVLPPETQ
jgi:hypothetical protein